MLYVITCTDKENSLDLRMSVRPDHLQYLQSAGDRVKIAGPLLSSDDEPKPIGSVIIIDAASDAAVQLFADNDPYTTAGLFSDVSIKPWKAAVGAWVPAE